jgi:hypothetical protein
MKIMITLKSKIIHTATRLHNYIEEQYKPEFGTIRLNADGSIDATGLERLGVELWPVTNEGDADIHRS